MQAKFQVGIYGSFDREKFQREWRPWFTGVEVTNLSSWEEAVEVVKFTRSMGIKFGIHHPLVKGQYEGFDPHLLVNSPDIDVMARSISLVNQALTEARELGAEYLLIHFPKPVILDTSLDWSDWRFVQPGEAIPQGEVDRAKLERISKRAFENLEQFSHEVGVPLILEMDILHAWYYQGMIRELYQAHPGLGLCLDTGRLHLQSATDPGFDVAAFVDSLKPWVTNIHLWTVQLGQNKKGGHHPLLPELLSSEGWGPMDEMLTKFCDIEEAWALFEHRSDLVTSEALERCYQWVSKQLCGTQRSS
ncbi:MAG: sugar phosphate isomerase/epimerase family protein [Bacillota bacterium]